MKKRIISMILAFVLLLGVSPVTAAAGNTLQIGKTVSTGSFDSITLSDTSGNAIGADMRLDGTTVYVAGDTDVTEEARAVLCDIALLPIGGTYTMNASEAAELVNGLKPKAVIPTHYGTLVGKPEDADDFEPLVNKEIQVCRKL